MVENFGGRRIQAEAVKSAYPKGCLVDRCQGYPGGCGYPRGCPIDH